MMNSNAYGGNATGGDPFLNALMLEMRKSAEYLCNRPDYAHLQMYYGGCGGAGNVLATLGTPL